MKTASFYGLLLGLCILGATFLTGCQSMAADPRPGEPASGAMLDKSGDGQLQKMIREIAPLFKQEHFRQEGMDLAYNLFTPANMEPGKKYPLVLFIADASTAGRDITAPLLQGYGALVWASPEAQAAHPCFVVVPQFSGVAVNDAYEHSKEADSVLPLLNEIAGKYPVDAARVYATGQSMGGMMAMYYNIEMPEIFAASLFVDCHWDEKGFDKLVQKPFIFVYAGDKGKSYKTMQAIDAAARKMGKSFTWSEWSARLPIAEQDALARTMLAKGQPINLIGFENGTVLPENVQGSEHMYSFDHAYRLAPLRDWLFRHSLETR